MERIFRLILCLIMVCSLLINCSPIQAEATGAGLATTWAAFAVAPEIAISAAMIALGVTVVVGSAAVLGGVVSECEQFLVENGYISGDSVDVYRADADSRIQYMISRELVEVIRDWLFDSGKLNSTTVLSGAEISVQTSLSGSCRDSFARLCKSSPENTLALIKGLGINSDVLILGQSSSLLFGYYFDEIGQLQYASFINPLGLVNSSLFGVYPLSSLELNKVIDFTLGIDSTPSDYTYSGPVFYSEDYAKRWEGFTTSSCHAFNWDVLPHVETPLIGSDGCYFHFTIKSAQNSVFTTSGNRYIGSSGATSCIGAFEWNTTTQSVVSSDLDLNVSGVASPDKSFSDGYSEWASGAKSLPTLRNGEISDAESMYLSLGMADTLEETMALIQSQAQGGTIAGSGTASDTVTATGLKGWLDTLRMTLVDGFSDLKAEWAEFTASFAGEKTEASTQGNQSVDQIIEIIPDDSQDYLAAFGSLVSVLSYEGTSAVIKMPALTVPALNGLFSEFTYLDEQEIDLEAYVNMLPDTLLLLIRALFDAALVLYCLKEFFQMLSGFVNNFSDAREVIYE